MTILVNTMPAKLGPRSMTGNIAGYPATRLMLIFTELMSVRRKPGRDGRRGLDYRGVASVLNSQGFFTNLVARMSGAKLENGKLSLPIRIEGTLQNPKFSVVD